MQGDVRRLEAILTTEPTSSASHRHRLVKLQKRLLAVERSKEKYLKHLELQANEDMLTNRRLREKKGRIETILVCGQCNASKARDAFVGSSDINLMWRGAASKTYNIYRCRACVYPSCASCYAVAKKKNNPCRRANERGNQAPRDGIVTDASNARFAANGRREPRPSAPLDPKIMPWFAVDASIRSANLAGIGTPGRELCGQTIPA
jgi:hypothetical protein